MSNASSYELTRPVFFIGFMGSGKSSVACAVARDAGLPFADLDTQIVEQAGCSISQIFAQQGQDEFRALEAAALHEVVQDTPQVVACGGGIVERQDNIDLMRANGYVVCLEVDFDEAAKRIGTDPDRPLFADREQARALAKAREALYHQAADTVIDTTGRSIAELSAAVRDILAREGVLR